MNQSPLAPRRALHGAQALLHPPHALEHVGTRRRRLCQDHRGPRCPWKGSPPGRLRWSSSTQPYLQVQPWLENLQVLQPSRGRGMNLLRLKGSLAAVGGVAVIAELTLDPPQRVGVRFQRGGLIGPRLGAIQGRLLTAVNQSFPAWLDITALDEHVRICRGNNGTLFVLRRRDDLNGDALIPNVRP